MSEEYVKVPLKDFKVSLEEDSDDPVLQLTMFAANYFGGVPDGMWADYEAVYVTTADHEKLRKIYIKWHRTRFPKAVKEMAHNDFVDACIFQGPRLLDRNQPLEPGFLYVKQPMFVPQEQDEECEPKKEKLPWER